MGIPIRVGVNNHATNVGQHPWHCPRCNDAVRATVTRDYLRFDLWGIPLFSRSVTHAYRCISCGASALGPRPQGVAPPPFLHRFGGLVFFVGPLTLWLAVSYGQARMRLAKADEEASKLAPVAERIEAVHQRTLSVFRSIKEKRERCSSLSSELSPKANRMLPAQAPADRAVLRDAPVIAASGMLVPKDDVFGAGLVCMERYPYPRVPDLPSKEDAAAAQKLDAYERELDALEKSTPPLPEVVVYVGEDFDATQHAYAVAVWSRTSDGTVVARAISDAKGKGQLAALRTSLGEKLAKW